MIYKNETVWVVDWSLRWASSAASSATFSVIWSTCWLARACASLKTTNFSWLAAFCTKSICCLAFNKIASWRSFKDRSSSANKTAFSASNCATRSCKLCLYSISIAAERSFASDNNCFCWAAVSATTLSIALDTASLISAVRFFEYSSIWLCVVPLFKNKTKFFFYF
jgi:hypothetical protein